MKCAVVYTFSLLLRTSAFSHSPPSNFIGNQVLQHYPQNGSSLTMRKQKASDKRTSRMQKNLDIESATTSLEIGSATSTLSPLKIRDLQEKYVFTKNQFESSISRGRGRSRKRSAVYNNLASYRNHFLELLTQEFTAEETLVRDRIDNAASDLMQSLLLEASGHALFDMYPQRRGNIFSDEVYRLVKAYDATSTYSLDQDTEDGGRQNLPQNSRFSQNDIIMLTKQPGGSGDFFGTFSIPTNKEAVTLEARVLATGPTYIDVAIPGGKFEATFGPAPNNVGPSGKGDTKLRLRSDRYFSNVPYNRMVEALGQLTSARQNDGKGSSKDGIDSSRHESHRRKPLDNVIRQTILNSFAYTNYDCPMSGDAEATKLNELAKQIAKPPFLDSVKLTNEVLTYLQSDPKNMFSPFNGPQLSAIGAALSRKLTLIQGPPGTGKTTVAASIAFGFVHQCRSSKHVPSYSKVLATAFSNIGADNLAEQLLRLGLKVVRIGKASAVSQSLWEHTLDAAIERDPDAKKALEEATLATCNLKNMKGGRGKNKIDIASERNKRDIATAAVKASIKACNSAAAKAMRDADVIVSTSIGASDPRLLAACGIKLDEDEVVSEFLNGNTKSAARTSNSDLTMIAPDGLPPLSMPFVIVDEACQSIEPGSLIPVFSTNSCRSLVMLGDPCQLPPTVISDSSGSGLSPLSISLMSRLASTLPQPVLVTARSDKTPRDELYLNLKMTKQAASLVRYRNKSSQNDVSYRKRYSGSLLLSVQYRMHPSIAAFSSAVFYDSLLSTPKSLSIKRPVPQELDDILPLEKGQVSVRFINIEGPQNENKGDSDLSEGSVLSSLETPLQQSSSYTNEAEALQVIDMLKAFMKNRLKSSTPFDGTIGVVTPYSGQAVLIKTIMSSDSEFRDLVQKGPISIEVNTIDSYQGRERDLIFFSTVRSNKKGNVGFLSDWRRMNVALTRAKMGLVVFGDMNTLVSDHHWEAFCKWCENVECVFDVELTDTNNQSFQ